jgi:hypothetical protein
MTTKVSIQNYQRAFREELSIGVDTGERREPTLDEARTELVQALSRFTKSILRDKYSPLVNAISEPTLTEALKNFESKLAHSKGDFTILLEEILDRMIPSFRNKKSDER